MPDRFSTAVRSQIMSKIRGKNTKLELSFLKVLSGTVYPQGLRYRKHYSKLFGKPDVVFVRQKVAIFIDSDFWHGKNFNVLKKQLKKRYWLDKISRNIKRDKDVNRKLKRMGWIVFRFNEKETIRSAEKSVKTVLVGLRSRYLRE